MVHSPTVNKRRLCFDRKLRYEAEAMPAPIRAGEVGWPEVELWLWPLFNEERWGAWRQDRLGLRPCPYEAEAEVIANPISARNPVRRCGLATASGHLEFCTDGELWTRNVRMVSAIVEVIEDKHR